MKYIALAIDSLYLFLKKTLPAYDMNFSEFEFHKLSSVFQVCRKKHIAVEKNSSIS